MRAILIALMLVISGCATIHPTYQCMGDTLYVKVSKAIYTPTETKCREIEQ